MKIGEMVQTNRLMQQLSLTPNVTKDSFSTQSAIFSKTSVLNLGMYSNKGTIPSQDAMKDFFDAVNFQITSTYVLSNDQSTVFYNGQSFSVSDLNNIHLPTKEMSVDDNHVVFDKSSYYQFTGKDGQVHYVSSTDHGSLGTVIYPGNDEKWDAESADFASFWQAMARKNPTGVSLEYSPNEVRERLADAGVKPGFFSITIGANTANQFLSQGKYAVAIYSKEQYDDYYYNTIMSGNLSKDYEPGSVFKFAGQEYVVNENRKLDIPYGVDIWDLESPSNYKFGKKIEE